MAVYTHIAESELVPFLAEYDLGALVAFEGIRQGVSNSNYHLFTDHGRYVLTLFESRTDPAGLPFFLSFANHLAAKGIGCPAALPGKDGRILRALAGRPAVIVTYLEGECVADAAITPPHCRALGAALAEMHRAAADFPMRHENGMGRAKWEELAADCRAKAAPATMALVDAELVFLAEAWPRGLPEGAVHADIFPDNVFFRDGDVSGVIDFYFACTDYFAYDLAIVLNAWGFDVSGRRDAARYEALLEAYEAVRPLSAEERAALPVLARAAALRFLLTRLQDSLFHSADSVVTPKDPGEYEAKLRALRGGAGA
jgi:homoserine kinase type II